MRKEIRKRYMVPSSLVESVNTPSLEGSPARRRAFQRPRIWWTDADMHRCAYAELGHLWEKGNGAQTPAEPPLDPTRALPRGRYHHAQEFSGISRARWVVRTPGIPFTQPRVNCGPRNRRPAGPTTRIRLFASSVRRRSLRYGLLGLKQRSKPWRLPCKVVS